MSDGTPGEPPDRFLPPDWAALAPLVDVVLDTPLHRRAAVLAEVSGGDPERRATLERLVAECERDLPLLNRPAAERFDQLLGEDEPIALPEVVGDRYRMGREVGRGGMARVYVASDLKHGRDVAIKVVRAELAASLGRDRFLKEIGIAARLRHPNIVPLYDSGVANGSLYFVMPFESGPSVRERVAQEGPLPVAEALSVLRDVARALQYAHEQGVVHRDIKPDNVLMSGGAAVVADFGIAKAFTAAQVDATQGLTTQTGVGMGTPAYMAPEQAVGDPSTDHRADIYSYGCLAYELFTAHPPFHGLPMHQIIAAHVGTVPPPLRELRADVPDGVARLVARCLEKNPDQRPQSATELLTALEQPGITPGLVRSPRFAKRTMALVTVALAVAVVGFTWWRWQGGTPASITVAVLPVVNIAKDSALDVFADGLSDEVATALARVPGVQIKSRSGARLYRGQLGVDVKEVGRKLAADYVVTGTMRQLDGRWIISTELTRTADAAELWSETFDRTPAQQLGVAEEIAGAYAARLRRIFPKSLGVAPALAEHQKTTPEAYRLYMLGQELLRRRGQSVKESAEAFRQAATIDPRYAGAFSGLSMALALYPYFQDARPASVYDEVTSSAKRALALDSALAQPHVALGLAYEHNREWDRAEAEFKTALRLQPGDAEARIQYGRFLTFRLRAREGLELFQAARRADPASALILSQVSYDYYLLGQQDSARVISEQAVQSGALNLTTRILGALVRLRDGRPAEARALVNDVTTVSPIVLYVLAASGDTATAMARLRAIESARPKPGFVESTRALVMLALRDTSAALNALQRATAADEIWFMVSSTSDHMFDPIRGSARFDAILREVGLPTSARARSP